MSVTTWLLPLLALASVRLLSASPVPASKPSTSTPLVTMREFKMAEYLQKFGYIDADLSLGDMKLKDFFPLCSNALKAFQNYQGLPETGEFDRATEERMNEPRCYNNDDDILQLVKENQAKDPSSQDFDELKAVRSVWPKQRINPLTYSVEKTPKGLDSRQVLDNIKQAFDEWASNSGLKIKQVASGGDIVMGFEPIDTEWEVLGRGYYPTTGKVIFDINEDWNLGAGTSGKGPNLRKVALHEIGHALGITHSDKKNTIMYPSYSHTLEGLTFDDLTAIRSAYGDPEQEESEEVLTEKATVVVPSPTPIGAGTKRRLVILNSDPESKFKKETYTEVTVSQEINQQRNTIIRTNNNGKEEVFTDEENKSEASSSTTIDRNGKVTTEVSDKPAKTDVFRNAEVRNERPVEFSEAKKEEPILTEPATSHVPEVVREEEPESEEVVEKSEEDEEPSEKTEPSSAEEPKHEETSDAEFAIPFRTRATSSIADPIDLSNGQLTGAISNMPLGRFLIVGKWKGAEIVDTKPDTPMEFAESLLWSSKAEIESRAAAKLINPVKMTLVDDDVVIVDKAYSCILRLTTTEVETIAGRCGTLGADDGDLLSASFNRPVDLCKSGSDSLLVLDQGNSKLRHVRTDVGVVSTWYELPTDSVFTSMTCKGNDVYLSANTDTEAQIYKLDLGRLDRGDALRRLAGVRREAKGQDGRSSSSAMAFGEFDSIVTTGNLLYVHDGNMLRQLDLASHTLDTVCGATDHFLAGKAGECSITKLGGIERIKDTVYGFDADHMKLFMIEERTTRRSLTRKSPFDFI